jgi:hypothetical protein
LYKKVVNSLDSRGRTSLRGKLGGASVCWYLPVVGGWWLVVCGLKKRDVVGSLDSHARSSLRVERKKRGLAQS